MYKEKKTFILADIVNPQKPGVLKNKQHFLRKHRNVRNVDRIFSFTFLIYLQQIGDATLLWH